MTKRAMLLMLLLAAAAIAANDYSGPPTGLIELWTFENTWTATVNSTPLSPVETAGFTTTNPMEGSYSATFDTAGATDYASTASASLPATFPGRAGSALTVVARVRFDTVTGTSTIAAIYKTDTGGRSWRLAYVSGSGWALAKGYNSGTTGDTGAVLAHTCTTGVDYCVGASTDEAGNWYIASYDGETLLTNSGAFASATAMVATSTNFTVGCHLAATGTANPLDGQIDELSVWNEELTPNEVNALVQDLYPPAATMGKAFLPGFNIGFNPGF